jgi:hypothetical protein
MCVPTLVPCRRGYHRSRSTVRLFGASRLRAGLRLASRRQDERIKRQRSPKRMKTRSAGKAERPLWVRSTGLRSEQQREGCAASRHSAGADDRPTRAGRAVLRHAPRCWMTNARTGAVALNAPRPAHLARKIACRFTSGERLCMQGGPLPRAAMPRDGADHHDLRGVCQRNRCGRESAEYIDDLRTPRAFSRPLARWARSRAPSSALGSQRTSTLEEAGFEPLVPRRRRVSSCCRSRYADFSAGADATDIIGSQKLASRGD